jgi:hypothetical protein
LKINLKHICWEEQVTGAIANHLIEEEKENGMMLTGKTPSGKPLLQICLEKESELKNCKPKTLGEYKTEFKREEALKENPPENWPLKQCMMTLLTDG